MQSINVVLSSLMMLGSEIRERLEIDVYRADCWHDIGARRLFPAPWWATSTPGVPTPWISTIQLYCYPPMFTSSLCPSLS